jgi:hypothetical protein
MKLRRDADALAGAAISAISGATAWRGTPGGARAMRLSNSAWLDSSSRMSGARTSRSAASNTVATARLCIVEREYAILIADAVPIRRRIDERDPARRSAAAAPAPT